ncbi:hypothetical protein [Mycobacterium sp. HUMS_1102779]|uniref:hypothetical protein n=1 Tax=Mycobacterium sp. HUMS_1102779 TaxID=3383487 RepID=UPI003899942E
MITATPRVREYHKAPNGYQTRATGTRRFVPGPIESDSATWCLRGIISPEEAAQHVGLGVRDVTHTIWMEEDHL